MRATLTLAEIRAGNTNYGPATPEETGTDSPLLSQGSDFNLNHTGLQRTGQTPEDGFAESLNEFEAQRNSMMSPVTTNFKDSRQDIFATGAPLHAPMKAPTQVSQQSPIQTPVQTPQQAPLQTTMQAPLQTTMHSQMQTPLQAPMQVSTQAPMQVSKQSPMQSSLQTPMQTPMKAPSQAPLQAPLQSPTVSTNSVGQQPNRPRTEYQTDQTKAGEVVIENLETGQTDYKHSAQSALMMNDDIKMCRPREKSSPRRASLQKDCQAHNVTPNAFRDQEKQKLVQQKSFEKDEPELMEINESTNYREQGRRDSHSSIRYRPETPRTVTPVRFNATPKLPHKGLAKGVDVKPKESQKEKMREDVISPAAPPAPPATFQAPIRNVSDSGISVNSECSEPDDSPGKIVAESMQKIEAQMRRILEHENKASVKEEKEASPVTPPPPAQATSGYSTSSEEDQRDNAGMSNTPFEVMEDFEEAPAEFDIGISSYSIAHPIENEEMEKTPIPEILETDEPPKFPFEETPYTVSTPSGTLKYDKKNQKEEKSRNEHQNVFETNQSKQDFSNFQIPPQSRPQHSQNYFNPPSFGESPFQNNIFNNNIGLPGFNMNPMMGKT